MDLKQTQAPRIMLPPNTPNTPSLSQSDTTQWLSTPAIQTYNNNQVQVKSSRPQREMTSLATVHGVTNTLGYNI